MALLGWSFSYRDTVLFDVAAYTFRADSNDPGKSKLQSLQSFSLGNFCPMQTGKTQWGTQFFRFPFSMNCETFQTDWVMVALAGEHCSLCLVVFGIASDH